MDMVPTIREKIRTLYYDEKLTRKEVCNLLLITPKELRRHINRMGILRYEYHKKWKDEHKIATISTLRQCTIEQYTKGQEIEINGARGVIQDISDNIIVVRFQNYNVCYSITELYNAGKLII